MFALFRRIRKQLVSEGNLGKYLKYAIGEIILVVIGILIALQVNNWNENRKSRSFEQEMLAQIRENLEVDKMDLKKVHRNLKKPFRRLLKSWNMNRNSILTV
ncbi:DUF6090 family protein [Flagellimonas sp. MMG031]|uniref:DUF6090 family protein n=1 Tax=Flagellimonas sp. MMG031 TaxID=3158549 RepID=A0AAU7MT35_9FLAO